MKTFILSFWIISATVISITSCQKDDLIHQGAKNAVEAEFRLGSAEKWIISDAKLNEAYIMKDRVLLDPDQNGMAEWLIFDTADKTVEVKYPKEDVSTFFDYIIENDIFKVIHQDGTEEVMTIRSGSVFIDRFNLEQTNGTYKLEMILVKQ